MKAKKSYGQHFLANEATAERIANFLDIAIPYYVEQCIKQERKQGQINVFEVGPGKGMLTKYLKQKDINLKAVEADSDMILHLSKAMPQVEVIALDFLKIKMEKVFDGNPFILIGNFPYNISSQIVFKMLNSKEMVPEMIGMFQKEMADRIVAPPGSKTYGVISVLTQAFYRGEILMKLAPGSFNPPPKVHSAVIRLTRQGVRELNCDARLFRTIVKMSFNQRRKMLRNTLKGLVQDAEILQEDFFNQRPEQLSVLDFEALTNKLEKHIKNELRNKDND